MSETTVLKARIRQKAGSNEAVRLRRQGQLPAVLYGHKKETVSISLDAHDFLEGLHGGARIFELDTDGRKETVLVKQLQYDYLGKDIVHADLMRVDLSERVKVEVSVELRGTAEGTHQGGMVELILDRLEVECRVSDIPEVIPVNIKHLGLNQAIHAGQIELPEGMKLITDPEAVVVTCHEAAAAKAEEAAPAEGAEAPTEPEVITERKPTEEAAS
ncbi:MAG TPA: 50S ribosomal protein L25 [Anaerohalosphaeraceae bacterium]|nr:50S ribosomal protein L25 [Phycisphaerae bacterium]HOK95368.1 50S ribosomal protein L25 [Anaerohalosphaeraceae bacterium]HOL31006.1 50S ribosomal protein L25 [Anaerohalosphaeraceae bacterium]HOM76108.1 50S ribosomal protein L25 [Anaerohalosphaeraceae bacterium]HPC63349.1 50S ribosomal protein L25 [Anaerohalosphaeraceae bacterium]